MFRQATQEQRKGGPWYIQECNKEDREEGQEISILLASGTVAMENYVCPCGKSHIHYCIKRSLELVVHFSLCFPSSSFPYFVLLAILYGEPKESGFRYLQALLE